MPKQYTDWRSWWYGLRKNLMKCIGTAGITWMGTNGLSATTGIIKGIDWEQALGFFGVHIAFEVFTYMQKVDLAIVETTDTSFQTKTANGIQVSQSSKTVTTTPVQPTNKQP